MNLRLGRSGPWVAGTALGVVVLGPVLRPGSLLNLDLVLTSHIPVPEGVWGLGPELPRRVPFFVPLAWLSSVIDGALVGKALMIATIAVACAGTIRLCRGASTPAAVAAGLVYAGGPFLTTRLAVGHLGTALAAALLPWALPTLLRPADDLRRTLLWSAALGSTGINGGIFAAAGVGVGLIADRGRRLPSVLGLLLVGQLPWLVPGIVIYAQGVDPAGLERFTTQLDGLEGALRLVGGQGFWLRPFEVGEGSIAIPIVAFLLLVLAALGHARLPPAWGRRALALAVVGVTVAASSGLPGLQRAYDSLASTTLGGPLREGHRMLPLLLVWLAPAAALGASAPGAHRDLRGIVLLSASLAFIGPALLGFGGRVDPVRLPEEWAAARAAVRADPGSVLALPWGQYVRPTVIEGRLVHHPAPYHLGGDVLVPSGRGAVDAPSERADPRAAAARAAVESLVSGAVSAPAEELGIRWIVVVETVDLDQSWLGSVPGIDAVVDGPTLDLYRMTGVDDAPAADVRPLLAPLAWSPEPSPVTWNRPGASGWLRGFDPAEITAVGTLRFPTGSGPIWYWPSLLVLLGHATTVAAVIVAFAPLTRGESRSTLRGRRGARSHGGSS